MIDTAVLTLAGLEPITNLMARQVCTDFAVVVRNVGLCIEGSDSNAYSFEHQGTTYEMTLGKSRNTLITISTNEWLFHWENAGMGLDGEMDKFERDMLVIKLSGLV